MLAVGNVQAVSGSVGTVGGGERAGGGREGGGVRQEHGTSVE